MIIVKTSNGDVFINDKAAIIVSHDREAKKVYVQPAIGIDNTIEKVEMVIYANDAQPTNWQDEGSEIQELRKTINRLNEDVDYANALNRFSRQAFEELVLVVEIVRSQLKMKEKKWSWDDIKHCLDPVDKKLEEINKERDKIMVKRLA